MFTIHGKSQYPYICERTAHPITRDETERQVKGYSGADFRGYTVAEGGRNAAERAFGEYIRSGQSESAISNT